jgi:hypothetical protein
MSLPDGSKLAALDTMQKLWSGKAPKVACPIINKLTVSGPNDVNAGDTLEASVDASDPQGDKLTYEWVIYHELSNYKTQEQGADAGKAIAGAIERNDKPKVSVKMSATNGVYRIYCYVRNEHHAAAAASLPVLVKGGQDPSFKAPLAKLP